MYEGHRSIAEWQSRYGVAFAYFGTDVLGNAHLTHNVVALAVNAGCCNRITHTHVEVNEIDDCLEYGGDDA